MTNTYQHPDSILLPSKHLIIGACINLLIVVFFISGVDNPKPEWGQYWFVRPIVVITCAGILNGILYNMLGGMRRQGGGKLIAALLISLFFFVFILWISSVLGFNGTLWN